MSLALSVLSHNWDNQDAVATIKRQLQLLLPGVQCFLDVDDLESIDDLEAYVEASQAMLVLLGSAAYMSSRNCQREVVAAQRLALPLVRVHDADASHSGAPLDELRRTSERHPLSRRHTEVLFGGGGGGGGPHEVIPWHASSLIIHYI